MSAFRGGLRCGALNPVNKRVQSMYVFDKNLDASVNQQEIYPS